MSQLRLNDRLAAPLRLRSTLAMNDGAPSSRPAPMLGEALMRQRLHAALAPAASSRSRMQRVLYFSAVSKSRRVAVRFSGFLAGVIAQSAEAPGVAKACSTAHSASICELVRANKSLSNGTPNCASPSALGSPSSKKSCSGAAQNITPPSLAFIAQAKANPSAAAWSPGASGMISLSGPPATTARMVSKACGACDSSRAGFPAARTKRNAAGVLEIDI